MKIERDHGASRRRLVIFPGALGDLICVVPALRAIGRQQPEAALELMARRELARFAVGRMGITRGHSIDRREVSQLFAMGESVDARAFFGGFDRIDSFFAAADARFRRSLESVARGEVHFYPFRPPGDGHVAECYLRAIGERSGAPVESRIDLPPDDSAAAARILERVGLGKQNFMLVFPGSGSAKKNWPLPNFCELASRMPTAMPAVFVLGPAEATLEPGLRRSKFVTLSGLELSEVAGLARAARCFVGNDSGVSHLAAAAGAMGFAMFGPTDPARWRPLGNVRVIRRDPLVALTVGEAAATINEAGLAAV
jgi:ADP-heptose:LPS heptosyltransferase